MMTNEKARTNTKRSDTEKRKKSMKYTNENEKVKMAASAILRAILPYIAECSISRPSFVHYWKGSRTPP